MHHVEEPIAQMEDFNMLSDSDMDVVDGLVPVFAACGFIPTSNPDDSKENIPPPAEDEGTIDDDATDVATEVATEVDLNEVMEDLDIDHDYEASESGDDSEYSEEDMDLADGDSEQGVDSDWGDDEERREGEDEEDEDYDPENVPIKKSSIDRIIDTFNHLYDSDARLSSSHHNEDDSMEDLVYGDTESDESGSAKSHDGDMEDTPTDDQGEPGCCIPSQMDMSDDDDESESEDDSEDDDEDDDTVWFPKFRFLARANYMEGYNEKQGIIHDLRPSNQPYSKYPTAKLHVLIEITTYDPPTRIRVPVKPLVLSSRVFSRIFGYEETGDAQPNKQALWDEDELIWYENLSFDWPNPAAMLWVLQTLTRGWVDWTEPVELALIRDIAVIVNRFELRDAMERFSAVWLGHVCVGPDRHVPSHKELVDWVLFITWVFQSGSGRDFRHATRGVIMDYTFKSKPKNGLLPRDMYEAIYQARVDLYRSLGIIIRKHWNSMAENNQKGFGTPCEHQSMYPWLSILKVTDNPSKYKASLSRVHQEMKSMVMNKFVLEPSACAWCERTVKTLQACEDEMRRILGIDCDGNQVHKSDCSERPCLHCPQFNFWRVSWPCLDWLGCESDERPCTRMHGLAMR
ncbi:hypothetical protein BO83DRAFT_443240 [Aspergillus eucalypticola CBS 122712]|uniref:BTB domain-containing protein n=1 Tax=Aspergillus eucalypticola (strain CBS 122712 / IBT 29274) TaxID=1448314 RepID=A0A317WJL2_ASPEC|nr:uncharacterized protein BO83DRAFT_443240 [Aspergillus eucalypticola CBS 122712]PWY85472.1 hypothetical protein BO83DRAFT_443240 [Aspergillus eucalypticola CBS 122712]